MTARSERLVWVDLEMTGLDPLRCKIIQIATLVTDSDLNLVAEGPNLVCHATEEELTSLSDWSRDMFTKSGLLAAVRASKVTRADAERSTLEFLKTHVTQGSSPLCGNSVWNDRQFLWHGMRSVHDFVHYRNIDVSSFKEVVRRWYPGDYSPPPKKNLHDALADIHESVEELRYYRRAFIGPRPTPA